VPDVLLTVSFVLAGVNGQNPILFADITAPSVTQAITTNIAGVLGVPAPSVHVANITDLATGLVDIVYVSGSASHALRRRLAAGLGSQGVSVACVANLGKTPTETSVIAMQAAVASANFSQAMQRVTLALATAKLVSPSAFVARAGPPPTVANAPFVLPAAAGAAAGGGADGGSGGSGGAIGGGVAVAAIVVGLALWSFRSYQKHGAVPCARNYAKEKREKAAAAAAALEARQMRLELQAAAQVTNNPIGGAAGGALSVRQLADANKRLTDEAARKAEEAERALAQIALFKAQVAGKVQAEVAEAGVSLAATAKAPPKRDVAAFGPSAAR